MQLLRIVFIAACAALQVFETTIRILGGLVSAYYHSGGDEMYLLKAIEYAERYAPSRALHATQSARPFQRTGL